MFRKLQKLIRKLIGIEACYNCGVLLGERGTPIVLNGEAPIDKQKFGSACERCFNKGFVFQEVNEAAKHFHHYFINLNDDEQ